MPDAIVVDPAFTDPAGPALYTCNRPAQGAVEALLADRERLTTFLAHGYRLYRQANARTWAGAERRGDLGTKPDGTEDPSFGQKSQADARREWLDHYAWLHAYGPTLLLLVDRGLLDGGVERAYRAAHTPAFRQAVAPGEPQP